MIWYIGIGFSLWRAVFQAGHNLKYEHGLQDGRIFLDAVIRNNTAVYHTELNSWSLGYYINNARFRLVIAWDKQRSFTPSVELDARMGDIERRMTGNATSGPAEWMECFHAMRLMIDAFDLMLKERSVS